MKVTSVVRISLSASDAQIEFVIVEGGGGLTLREYIIYV